MGRILFRTKIRRVDKNTWIKSYKKENISRQGKKYFTNLQVAEFNIESFNLKKGDNILITGKTTGVIETIVDEMRNNDKLVTDVKKGDNFSMKLDYFIRPNDRLYKVVNAK